MWRVVIVASLLLLSSNVMAQDTTDQSAQDKAEQAARDASEQARLDRDAQRVKEESEKASQEVGEAAFVGSVTLDILHRHVFDFGPGQPTIVVYVNDTLVREASSFEEEPSLHKLDPIETLYEQGFGVRLRATDRDYFELSCHAGIDEGSLCGISSGYSSPLDTYDISGSVFVIPGDGCIYAHYGAWETSETLGLARSVNCLRGGQLQPAIWPPGRDTASGSGI